MARGLVPRFKVQGSEIKTVVVFPTPNNTWLLFIFFTWACMPFALKDLFTFFLSIMWECVILYPGKVKGVLESLSTSCQLKVNFFLFRPHCMLSGCSYNKLNDQSYSEQVPLEVRISAGKNWEKLGRTASHVCWNMNDSAFVSVTTFTLFKLCHDCIVAHARMTARASEYIHQLLITLVNCSQVYVYSQVSSVY